MKLIYLHQYFKFPDETGGTRSYDLASSFVNNGIDVTVVTSTSDEKYKIKQRWVEIERDGIKVHYVYLPYGNHLSYLQRSFVFFKFLWFSSFHLLKLKADVVLATSTPLTIGIPALIKKWFGKTPFVFEVRDVWPEAVIAIGALNNKVLQKVLYKLEEIIYKNAAAIVPLSVDMKRSITTRYPKLNHKPIVVIENISEINRFQNEFDKDYGVLKEKIGFQPRFPILYAGTFGRVNGISYVIALAEKTMLLDPSIVFVLIGDGAEKNPIRQEAMEKGVLNKNVFILESVSKQELPQLYYECAMGSSFVIPIPELWANSANKFFDTLAAGKPVLINHEGWQKEVILNKEIGYVLPGQLTDAAVSDFVLYANNSLNIEKQQQNALTVAKLNYSLEVALVKYNKIFTIINQNSVLNNV